MVKPDQAEASATEAALPAAAGAEPKPPAPVHAEPLPTLEDVAALPRGADVRRFVAPGVAPEVRNGALKKLFADPHFNVMDGLDTYIDDYGKPDPLPAGMLRQMVQSQMLGLFKDEEPERKPDVLVATASIESDSSPAQPQADPTPTPAIAVETAPDEDPDLRLQPHHAAGPGRPAPGTEPDPGRQR